MSAGEHAEGPRNKSPETLHARRRSMFLLGSQDARSPLAKLRSGGIHLLELIWETAHPYHGIWDREREKHTSYDLERVNQDHKDRGIYEYDDTGKLWISKTVGCDDTGKLCVKLRPISDGVRKARKYYVPRSIRLGKKLWNSVVLCDRNPGISSLLVLASLAY